MYKKFLRLALTGALLFQTGNICTFAYNKDEFDITKEPEMVDYCKNFPKNQYGQTVNINCAFRQLMIDKKANNGREPGIATRVGPNGDYEVRIWNKDQIQEFANEFKNLIQKRNKNALKHEFIGNLIDATNSLLSLNSTNLAAEVTKKLATKSNLFLNEEITPEEVESWKEDYKVLPKYTPNITYWGTYGIWGICPICLYDFRQRKKQLEDAFKESLRREQVRQAQEEKIKAEVYFSVVDQVIHSILNKRYVGKDSLVANLDFSKDNYKAQTYFTDIGLSRKICAQDVEPINNYIEASSKSQSQNVSNDKKEDL